jgi:hypothetical protein
VFSSWLRTIKDYLKGFFLYSLLTNLYSQKRCTENLFMLGIFGSEIGFPFLFNYYHLGLLPYYVRQLGPWKKRVLKERDFFDHISD